ncbi:MAG TPA: FtsX-like permease family protein [Armatimonadota bacterium]|nr:FtsX-like permease family protein [Armatimonadota bacterium]
MSDLKLAFTYLRSRPLVTILTIVSVTLGLGLATIVLMLSRQTQDMLGSETASWDMVIGAKGSPLQLILNSLYYIDQPVGNVNISVWNRLQHDPAVARVIPLTMGDNYLGWPIVGTTPSFFAGRQAFNGGQLLATGSMFTKPFEVVVGSDIAVQQHLHVGKTFIGAHGWGRTGDLHPQFPYTVVGILARTGSNLDRALFTDYHSTWIVHSHPDADERPEPGHDPSKEVTSLLVQLHQPGSRFMLTQDINRHEMAMAVSPVEEISNLSATFIAPLQSILLLVAYLVVFVSALSILISLYLTINQRRRDLAILRSLGATRANVFGLITLEAAMLSGIGVVFGWIFGHGMIALCAPAIAAHFGISLFPWQVKSVEFIIMASVWGLGIVAGLLPAFVAYRMPVANTLVRE